MNKYLGHLKTILKHKYYVGIECFRLGLYWQGLVHDLSKFHPTEFLNSVNYYTGYRSPIGLEKADKGYSKAWLHHKTNKHHWEYWVDFKEGEILKCPIPYKYVLEMACDMIGASKAYGTNDPLRHFLSHKYRIHMHKDALKKLEQLLTFYSIGELCSLTAKIPVNKY